MAFTQSIIAKTVFGNKRIVLGTYDCTAVTGGDISTGLKSVDMCILTPTGAAVDTNEASVNETMPLNGGDVTIVTDSGATGQFLAIGN